MPSRILGAYSFSNVTFGPTLIPIKLIKVAINDHCESEQSWIRASTLWRRRSDTSWEDAGRFSQFVHDYDPFDR